MDKQKNFLQKQWDKAAANPAGYSKNAAKKSFEYAKENPLKTTAAFFILPFDWVIGAPISIAITACGAGYGGKKLYDEQQKKKGAKPDLKNFKTRK